MPARYKTIEDLLDIESELKEKIKNEEDQSYYQLISVYRSLYRRISKERNNDYRDSLPQIKNKLIHHLVVHGTYLKTVYQQDDYTAERTLEEALSLDENLPIANYRLGFLKYKQKDFSRALLYFQNAITWQEREDNLNYKMNEQQLYNCHLYLSNCGLFIAKEAQENLDKLHYDSQKLPDYELSPLFELLSINEEYLRGHEYCFIKEGEKKYCSQERCHMYREETRNTVVLDFAQRELSLYFNGQRISLSKNQAEILRNFMLESTSDHPLVRHDFSDIISVYKETGEVKKNTFIQNVNRIINKLKDEGMPEMLTNKNIKDETGYFYNPKYPYIILHRNDDSLLFD